MNMWLMPASFSAPIVIDDAISVNASYAEVVKDVSDNKEFCVHAGFARFRDGRCFKL
jgi:hypothetical protein